MGDAENHRIIGWVAIVLLILGLTGSMLRIWPAIVINMQAVNLLSLPPSIDVMSNYWYGAGLRALTEIERQQLFDMHAINFSTASCQEWEENGLARPGVPNCANCEKSSLALLVEARDQECAGRANDALSTLDRESMFGRFDAQKVGLYKSLGRMNDAKAVLQKNLCSTPTEWCEGYIAYLLGVWYHLDFSNTSTSSQTADNLNGPEFSAPESDFQYNRLQLSGIYGVQIDREVPLVLSDAFSLLRDDNYLAYPVIPVIGTQVEQRIVGEVLSDSPCDLYGRIVFWASDGNGYIDEIAQKFSLSGNFDVTHTTSLPEGTRTVTPRITFSDECFKQDQQVVIYDVNVTFTD